MKQRFEGENGKRLLIDTLKAQMTVNGNTELAIMIADLVEVQEIPKGTVLITQEEYTNDIYFILAGSFQIIINGRHLHNRHANELVGEMTAVEPSQKRSATVMADEDSLVAKMAESDFSEIGSKHPELYKGIAKVLARRLLQRNNLIASKHSKPKVFIISSVEGKPIADLIQLGLEHDKYEVVIWTDGVFRVTNYTMESLENQVDEADFAIAVASGDDILEVRDQTWPAVRDNVIFELGLFMGRLGRHRAILMEPRDEKVKLPSDLAGITTITYRYEKDGNNQALLGPAVTKIRQHITAHGLK